MTAIIIQDCATHCNRLLKKTKPQRFERIRSTINNPKFHKSRTARINVGFSRISFAARFPFIHLQHLNKSRRNRSFNSNIQATTLLVLRVKDCTYFEVSHFTRMQDNNKILAKFIKGRQYHEHEQSLAKKGFSTSIAGCVRHAMLTLRISSGSSLPFSVKLS